MRPRFIPRFIPYGYTTKRDLTRIGSLLFMALIGLVLAMVVNFFLHNPMLYWIMSFVGVLIFVGLAAFDRQRLATSPCKPRTIRGWVPAWRWWDR